MKPPANTVERRLRAVLRDPKYVEVLTVAQMCAVAGTRRDTTSVILNRMPDAYIDRWTKTQYGAPGTWAAVWCVVVPPEHCPRPKKKG